MLSKNSRYRGLPDIVLKDEGGIVRKSLTLRRLPEVNARFEHTLKESDRPDHIAFKYYQQSRNWWQISDANPDFKSPRELFGKSADQISAFSLRYVGTVAPWNDMFAALRARLGVLSVEKGNADFPLPAVEVSDGTALFTIPAALSTDLTSSAFAQELTASLRAALSAGGLTLGTEILLSHMSATVWRLKDRQTEDVFTLAESTSGGPIAVSDTVIRHSWSTTIRSNRKNISPGEIRDQIALFGFGVDAPQTKSRIGKAIRVPPVTG